MTRLWIAILFAAIVVLPVQSRLVASCACHAQAASSAEGLATPADSCCASPRGGSEPDREGPSDDDRGPCDDCPRPCCTVLKITVTPLTAAREHPRAAAMREPIASSEGAVRSPHLDRLERPPQPITSVS